MSDQVRAAAERLADYDLGLFQGPTGDDADMRAGIVLARHYRAEHPADENEPIDEDFLRSVGFEKRPPDHGFRRWTLDASNGRVSVLKIDERFDIEGWSMGCNASFKIRHERIQRGQLISLCRALNIPIKEQV